MKIREICEKINKAPTMLVCIRMGGIPRLVVGYAPYNPAKDEGTLTFYHGPLERYLGVEILPDGVHMPTEEWTTKVAFRGENHGISGEVEMYLTEYDMIGVNQEYRGPEDFPLWAAKAWAGRWRLAVRRGELTRRAAKKVMKKIEAIERNVRIEEAIMKVETSKRYVNSLMKRREVK